MPPSVEVESYERILPGAADRIFSMAEEYAGHQGRLESKAIEYQASDQKWGRIVALIAVVLVLAVCVYALHLGHVDFATELGTWTVVALAG